jgi:DUF2971 family protein
MPNDELRPKGLLYHYTSAEGFLGIIRSGKIWATHVRYLNDSQEFVDCLSHLDAYVDELGGEMRELAVRFLQSTLNLFSSNPGVFVVSFTDDASANTNDEPGDRLSQWRAYCASGTGFSLGFDSRAIDGPGRGEMLGKGPYLAYLHNCIYDPASKRRVLQGAGEFVAREWREFFDGISEDLLRRAIELGGHQAGMNLGNEELHSLARHLSPPIPDTFKGRLAEIRRNMMMSLVLNATSMKNAAFSDEKEWRIVVHPGAPGAGDGQKYEPPIKFRSGRFGITPYIEFSLSLGARESPLRRIVVGPGPHPDESFHAAKMFLRDSGIVLRTESTAEGVEVVSSRIPFRYW